MRCELVRGRYQVDATHPQPGVELKKTSSITLGPIQFEHAGLHTSKALLLQLIADQNRPITLVGYINPHVFNIACEDNDVKKFISHCKLCCIDGIGVQLAALVLRRVKAARLVADELFNSLAWDASFNCKAVLIGVTSDELMLATNAINQDSKSIQIVGGIDGFQNDQKYKNWLSEHRQTDVILIGAGTPRSEQIALIAQHVCKNPIIWHIGAGTIKTWAGTKRRAPIWISRLGVQWLHRMCFEPHTRTRYTSGAIRFIKNLSSTISTDKNGTI